MLKVVSYEVESPEWFELRRSHVTASDAGKIWAGTNLHSIAREKLHSTFTGNKYTEWGKQREPVIAAHLAFTEDLIPTDDIYVADFGKFSASPDMVSQDLKRLGEIKTVVAKNAWSDLNGIPANYYGQMQWQMLVTGADEVVLGWEPHTDFEPSPIETLVVRRDNECITQLIDGANQLLEILDDDAPDMALEDMTRRFLETKMAHEAARAEIEDYMRKNGLESGESTVATVSYRFAKASQRFDQTAFKEAQPEMFNQFVKLSEPSKPTLRITARKAE